VNGMGIAVALAAVVLAVLLIVALRGTTSRRGPAGVGSEAGSLGMAPSTGACSIAGCQKHSTFPCSYRETTGARCGLRRCEDHVEMVGGKPYCHRHAGVVKALSDTEGSILQVKGQPSLNDRAVPLLNLVCEALDPMITTLLSDAVKAHPDVQVARQKTVHEVLSGADRVAWQSNWGLNTTRGYLLRLAIRVSVAEPPTVQAIVDTKVVFQGVPNWIARRLRNEPPDPTDNGTFEHAMFAAIEKAVKGRMVAVDEQLEYEKEKFHEAPPQSRF